MCIRTATYREGGMIRNKCHIKSVYSYGHCIRDVRGCKEYDCRPEYLAEKLHLELSEVGKMSLGERLNLAKTIPYNLRTFPARLR
jgi:hypothetical protein